MRALTLLAIMVLLPSWADAQATDSSSDLSTSLANARLGKTKLRVETKIGGQFEGNYHGLDNNELLLHYVHGVKVDPILISTDSVAAVWEGHTHEVRAGLIGLAVGFGLGAAIPPDNNAWASEGASRVVQGVVVGLVGTGIGLLIGHNSTSWELLYPD